MSKKWQYALIIVSLAVSIALILWLTIFSRLGSYTRHFYTPFSSYKAVFSGSGKALLEIAGNIVLFIPVGVMLSLFFRLDLRSSLLFGFALSLIIESCQWFFWLGSFEIDDLIHNTIGTGIGLLLITRTPLRNKFDPRNRKKSIIAFIVLTTVIIASVFAYHDLQWQELRRLAAMNDRDGSKNLLVLSPRPSYMGKSEVNVTYNSDGSILIEGSSENRAWIIIGKLSLGEGDYVFSGLSGVEEKTIAIVLDYYNQEQDKYLRLTKDIGVIEKDTFTIFEPTIVRALVSIYPSANGRFIARPALYRIEKEINYLGE